MDNKVIALAAAVAGVVLIAIGAMLIFNRSMPQPPSSPPTVAVQSVKMVDGLITIEARSYQEFPFIVDTATMKNVVVCGEFIASGGLRNNITTLILDDFSFINWLNYNEFNALYTSGRVTVAEFNVPVTQSNTYHLVFDNRPSLVAKKTVNASVTLNYAQ